MTQLTKRPAWQALKQHYDAIADHSMQTWFAEDPDRFARFSLSFDSLLLDFSKNRMTPETLSLLVKLAEEVNLAESINALFSGQPVNFTEHRPALHMALRDRKSESLKVNGHNVMADIQAELKKMHNLVDRVHQEKWLGATGKPIRDIVNIGIGGSHLGPLMVSAALKSYADPRFHCYFISNVDGSELFDVLKKINPEQTLFIISSKSFSTIETLSSASVIRQWLQEKIGQKDISSHFIAVTAAREKAIKWGIPDTHIFSIWDFVGGRYSVWSAIGLPVALLIGMENFYAFLDGAHAMDIHFKQTEFSKNWPVLLGLLGIWYINFFGCAQQAIIPYAHELRYFRNYIQQADMESNGKSVTRLNQQVNYPTGPVILGQQGGDSQHSFFQHLHQAPNFMPVDFILTAKGAHFQELQPLLIASALSQAEALMKGRCTDAEKNHQSIPGNRPSTVLFMEKITPHALGLLMALYEHKIFVQGVIWDINSFDQFGVELGKQLLPAILDDLKQSQETGQQDASTAGLIHYYRSIV